MHYYKLNISDWNLATAHLSLEEEAVYFRLINFYYDTEQPIPTETQSVIRRLRLGCHSDTVGLILNEFFELREDGWHKDRCDLEIDLYHNKADKNKENGKKGGRPKKINELDDNPEITQMVSKNNPNITLTNNHKPITNNQEPVIDLGAKAPKRTKFVAPTLDEIKQYCQEENLTMNAEKFFYHFEANGWKSGSSKIQNWKMACKKWASSDYSKPAIKQPVRHGEWLADEIFEGDLPLTNLLKVN
jgi:uncharacterized protein YdaU (DUF1376 family)